MRKRRYFSSHSPPETHIGAVKSTESHTPSLPFWVSRLRTSRTVTFIPPSWFSVLYAAGAEASVPVQRSSSPRILNDDIARMRPWSPSAHCAWRASGASRKMMSDARIFFMQRAQFLTSHWSRFFLTNVSL